MLRGGPAGPASAPGFCPHLLAPGALHPPKASRLAGRNTHPSWAPLAVHPVLPSRVGASPSVRGAGVLENLCTLHGPTAASCVDSQARPGPARRAHDGATLPPPPVRHRTGTGWPSLRTPPCAFPAVSFSRFSPELSSVLTAHGQHQPRVVAQSFLTLDGVPRGLLVSGCRLASEAACVFPSWSSHTQRQPRQRTRLLRVPHSKVPRKTQDRWVWGRFLEVWATERCPSHTLQPPCSKGPVSSGSL